MAAYVHRYEVAMELERLLLEADSLVDWFDWPWFVFIEFGG